MKLDPKIKREVERELQRKIPNPKDEGYAPFLEELRVMHPHLFEKLDRAVILESLGDPQTTAERRAHTADFFRRVKHSLFYRYDDLQGRWLVSRIKLTLLTLVPVLLGLVAFYSQNLFRTVGAVQAQAGDTARSIGAELGFGTGFQSDFQETGVPDLPVQASESRGTTNPVTPKVSTASPSPLNQQSQASQSSPSPQPPAPEPLQPTGVFTREASSKTNVFTRPMEATTQSDPFSGGATTNVKSLSVYTAQREPTALSVQGDETQNTLSVYDGRTEGALSVYEPSSSSGQPQETQAEASLNTPSVESSSDPFATGTADVAPDTAPTPTLQAGTRINAVLEVGIIAVGIDTTPVIARGDDGSVWQGTARLSDANRFTLEFSAVTINGQTQDVQARAVAEDGYADLPATIKETTPALASDLLRGSLRGVSNYVDDLGKQTVTAIDQFGKTITRTAPSLENQILGSVSDLFSPTTDQALVRVTELPAGTRFSIVIF